MWTCDIIIEQLNTGAKSPGVFPLGGETVTKCEICDEATARYEAVFAVPSGYFIKNVCGVCVYEENRVTSPVEILDTTFSRE